MIPIHQLLSRIRWDPEYGRAEFILGYYDRLLGEVVRVPLAEVVFPAERHDIIQVLNGDGVMHSIPLHRIKEVYRDNILIWHRKGYPGSHCIG
ncbi:MAG: DUF504 domain-containing protein [Desulfobulbaceae bacterium]